MKKFRISAALSLFLFVIVLGAFFATSSMAAPEPPPITGAKSAYFYSIDRKTVMAEKDSTMQVYPASTVKLMTGIVAIENHSGRLDETVTVKEEMLSGVTGNKMGLKAGERVKIIDLLYGILCGGSNDSAAVLVHVVSGSIDGFVALMNEKAVLLGALDTHYENVSGMHDPKMVTTAYDTFLIAKAASEIPLFIEITSESRYQMAATNMREGRNIYSKNYLISRYSETKYYNRYAMGLNSGSTTQGGYCLATFTEKDGQKYICVVMGGEDRGGEITSYTTANELINWAYSSFGYVEVISPDRLVCEVRVELSEDVDYVTLHPKESLTVFMPLDTDLEGELVYSHKLTAAALEAPVEQGQVAGFITVELDGEVLGSVELITMNKVERSEFLFALKKIRDFTTSTAFIASAITFVVLMVVYIFGTAIYRGKPNRRRRRYR